MGKRLVKTNRSDYWIFGVCGGLAKYLDINPVIIRAIVAMLGFLSFGSVGIIYFVAAFIMPKED